RCGRAFNSATETKAARDCRAQGTRRRWSARRVLSDGDRPSAQDSFRNTRLSGIAPSDISISAGFVARFGLLITWLAWGGSRALWRVPISIPAVGVPIFVLFDDDRFFKVRELS